MAENFQDNVVYSVSTLAVSGDAVAIGSTNAGAKSVIFASSNTVGHFAWLPTANRTINLPDAGGTVMLTSQAILSLSAGTTRAISGEVVFSNSNGISFGLNAQTLTGSYTVPSTAGLLSAVNLSAGTTSNNLSAFVFSNSNNVSFGLNGSTVTATISVPAQTVQTVGLYGVGNTTQNSSTTLDARTISFDGLGAASVGFSNGSVQISVPAVVAQSNQTVGLYALGNTTQNSSTTMDARTLSFNALGAATMGYSNGSIQVSVPTQTAQTQSLIQAIYDGANSITTGTIRFTNANGVSFSINGQTLSGSVAAQTAQTIGLYAVSNTTQNSSTTLDARTLSFQGAGIASVGYSNGSIIVSVPTGAPSPVNFSAGTTSNNLGSVVFSNSNGVSFGLNGSTITASVAAAAGAQSLYALGNTTQNSSTTLSSLSFNALGAMTWGYSNGSIQVSAPATSSLSATGIISISTNGSTISIGANNNTLSVWDPYYPIYTSTAFSSHDASLFFFNRVVLPDPVAISYINVIKSHNFALPTATSQNSSGTHQYTYSHGVTVYTRQDYAANSSNLSSYTTASIGLTLGYTFSSSSQSINISYVTNSTGGATSFSTTSGSNALSSYMTGPKMWRIPFVTTLSVGEYFFVHAHSSTRSVSTGTNTSANNATNFSVSNMQLHNPISNVSFGTVGSTVTFAMSNMAGGIGHGPSTTLTSTTTMAGSVMSLNASAHYWHMNFSAV